MAAGLHVVLRLPDDVDDSVVQQHLADRDINAPALSTYTRGGTGAPYPGLVLGYAATSPDRLRAAVAEIAQAMQ